MALKIKSEEEWNSLLGTCPINSAPKLGALSLLRRGTKRIRKYLSLGILKPGDRVIDIGCGAGPTAIGLEQLAVPCQYTGFDTKILSIKWCREAFKKDPRFEFFHVNVYSDRYNRDGVMDPAHLFFPCTSGTADLVTANSLFTHMGDPENAIRYLRETSRVLKPGGFAYVTWYRSPPYETDHGTRRSCYREKDIKQWITDSKLEIIQDFGGCGERPERKDRQWKILLAKGSHSFVSRTATSTGSE